VHTSGQTVTPSFDGWFKNADGSINLVFGYFNRNHDQSLDVPIGSDNKFTPGSDDRGQPTHFLPQRQFGVFVAVVPGDFGKQTVTWTLTTQGQALSVPGYIRPEWEISAMEELTSGRQPPVMRFSSDGRAMQGPAGPTTSRTATAGTPLALDVWLAGPRPTEEEQASAKTPVSWGLHRGAVAVTFDKAEQRIDRPGRTTTLATFARAGEYTLRVVAGRPATTGCCWTTAFVKVSVR
jgi:hypothetical protein